MESSRREREEDGAIVTFYAPDRTFARVYKGQSLDETKDMVRKKLGLADDASIRFERLHEGKVIELDDDDDFEAFRYLARHATSLDVTVIVGGRGPAIFSETLQGPLPLPNSGNKRRKGQLIGTIATSPGIVPTSGLSDSARTSSTPSSSTLDANGVPKKKRKRKHDIPTDRSSLARSSPQAAVGAQQSSSPSLHISPGDNMDAAASQRTAAAPVNSTSSSLPASFLVGDVCPKESLVSTTGSKRKRHESPEADASSSAGQVVNVASSVPAQLSSPLSPSKKRRRVKSAAEPNMASAHNVESRPPIESDREGDPKPHGRASTIEQSRQADVVVETDASSVNKKEKRKAKRKIEAKEKGKPDTIEPTLAAGDAKQSKKRRRDEADQPTAVVDTVSVDLDTVQAERTESSQTVLEGRRKGSVALETDSRYSAAPEPSSNAALTKARKEKKSKSKSHKKDQVSVDASGNLDSAAGPSTVHDSTSEKSQGKEISQTDTSGDVPPSISDSHASDKPTDASEDTIDVQDEPDSASAKRPKRDRKKSLPSASSQAAMMAAVQAAFQAVLARGPSASTATGSSAPATQEEVTIPSRKRNVGRSKLHQTWGPTDLENNAHASAAASASHVPHTSVSTKASSKVSAPAKPAHSKARPSSVPACPICDQASVHLRSQCPVVVAGPSSLRKRIAQLKKAGGSEELVDELEVLHEEAKRRRETAAGSLPAHLPPPIETPPVALPAGEAPPSSPDLPPQSSFSASSKRRSLPHRSISNPRIPAGSEISEVAVESKDEGSSNENSTSEDEDVASAPTIPLEALLYGPTKPRRSILAQIPSSSESSEAESSDEEDAQDDDANLDLEEEEEKNDRTFGRMSRKFAREVSSSDDGWEMQPEPDNAEMDVDDVVIPLNVMDPGPNDSIEDARQVEENVLSQEAAEQGEQSDASDSDGKSANHQEPEVSDKGSDSEDGVVEGGEKARSASHVSSADRGENHRVERTAEDDPTDPQENPGVSVEEPGQPEGDDDDDDDDDGSVQGDPAAGTSLQVDEPHEDDAENMAIMTAADGNRELSPELGEPAPAAGQTDNDTSMDPSYAASADVDPQKADPANPTRSLRAADNERLGPLEADTMKQSNANPAQSRMHTPPPGPPRTPGTASRMKDRYGRLQQARTRSTTSRLPSLVSEPPLPETQLTLSMDVQPETSLQLEIASEHEAEAGDSAGEAAEEKTQDARDASQALEDAATRPRRTTRATTRRTSTVSFAKETSPIPATAPAPVPAPAMKRRGKLSEEKARREAEKAEKKAERERIAEEKKAAKDAKRAEKDAKRADKDAKRAKKEETAKRGTTRGRGRGSRGAKSMSTRAQCVDEEEQEEVPPAEAKGDQAKDSRPPVAGSETPGVSKVLWATLSQSAPRTQTESVGDVSSLIDELQPSSPEPVSHGTLDNGKDTDDEATVIQDPADDHADGEREDLPAITPKPKGGRKEPLFIPSSSQVPNTPFGLPAAESTPFHDPDGHREGESEDEDQEKTFKAPSRPRPSWYSQVMYPTLTNLASQQLFPATQISSPALFSQTPKANGSFKLRPASYNKSGGGVDNDEESSGDDGSDSSDSDAGKKTSHIPQNRRASAGVQKKKRYGLLSAYD